MATDSLATRIQAASASIEGVAAILNDLVSSSDLDASRKAYSCADLLKRVGIDLDHLAVDANAVASP